MGKITIDEIRAMSESEAAAAVISALASLRESDRESGGRLFSDLSASESDYWIALNAELMKAFKRELVYQCDECLEFVLIGGEADRGEYGRELLGNDPYCLKCARSLFAKHGGTIGEAQREADRESESESAECREAIEAMIQASESDREAIEAASDSKREAKIQAMSESEREQFESAYLALSGGRKREALTGELVASNFIKSGPRIVGTAISAAASLEATAASASKRASIAAASAMSAAIVYDNCERASEHSELSELSGPLKATAFTSLLMSAHLSIADLNAKQLEALSARALEAAAVAFSHMSEADREQLLRSTIEAASHCLEAARALIGALSGESATAKSKIIDRTAAALLASAKRSLYIAVMSDRYFYGTGERLSGESLSERLLIINRAISEAAAALSEEIASEADRESLDIPIERAFKRELLDAIGTAASELLSGRYTCNECGGTGEL